LSAFLVFITALIFYCQLSEMQKVYGPIKISSDAAKEAADATQLPILWLSEKMGDFKPSLITPDKAIVWTWEYKNYGKGIAFDFVFYDSISIGVNQPFEVVNGPSAPVPMPPGERGFTTIRSKWPTTSEQFEALLKVDGGISIAGVMRYSDSFGTRYESKFCQTRLATGAISHCVAENYIKKQQ
jgi:hypothetical protein